MNAPEFLLFPKSIYLDGEFTAGEYETLTRTAREWAKAAPDLARRIGEKFSLTRPREFYDGQVVSLDAVVRHFAREFDHPDEAVRDKLRMVANTLFATVLAAEGRESVFKELR